MAVILKIFKYTHFFKVHVYTQQARTAAFQFSRRYIHYGVVGRSGKNSYRQGMLKVFAAATADRFEFRFHINVYQEFLDSLLLHQIDRNKIKIVEEPVPDYLPINVKVKDIWQVRPHQEAPLAYAIDNESKERTRLIGMPTGRGKTFTALKAISIINASTLICVKSGYVEKWVEDIYKTFDDIKEEDIMVVRGSNQLIALLELANRGEITWKFIVMSNKTLQNWYKLYEKFRNETLEMGYACLPDEMHKLLKVGVHLTDEGHQDFHLNFKIALYTNVARSITLSATLISDDRFIEQMQELQFPKAKRYEDLTYNKYVNSFIVEYRFRDPKQIHSTNYAMGSYSHMLFEQSIIKNKEILNNYCQLIADVFEQTYVKRREKGRRCLIYVHLIEFCDILVKFLKSKYPDIDIRKYTAEDPYENLMESEVSVSTLGSAGTGHDISGLISVVLTPAVNSSQSNIQGFGRLRELKDIPVAPEFYYFVNLDNEKHKDYSERKLAILKDRTASIKTISYHKKL